MQLLRHSEIEVIDLQPPRSAGICGRTWPCPLCGQRRPTDLATHANIRERVGPSFQRWILVCDECTGQLS
ncbi:MAG: hypothetical protein M3133_02920 [Actinomycetota bacterium]|nr:hypothetical protein [Actinomycetota bacterium]